MKNRSFYFTFGIICLFLLGTGGHSLQAQNCSSLYVITESDGRVYSINVGSGSKSLQTTMSSGRENLAVGPDPANTGSTVFTSSQIPSGSIVYKSNNSIGTTLPTTLNGFAANPATSGATAGYVYGISSARQLIQASPSAAANLGTITGDATWSSAIMGGDVFFDDSDNLMTIVSVGSADYLYRIEPSTLTATQVVQISGSLPPSYDAIAFLGDKIYVGSVYTTTSGLLLFSTTTYHIRLYEINSNSGQSTQGASVTFSSSNIGNIDFATCDAYTPPAGPTCNELFGVIGTTQTIYRIDIATLSTTQVSDGNQTNQGNMAFGPMPSDLNQNQFVTGRNDNDGDIYSATNGGATLSNTGNTWGSPIGIGTDPATGIVYGISSKTLSSWTGTGNGTDLGTVTGDATWTSGTTLNDVAVDAGGNLYSILFSGSNTYLYRIDPSTLTATQVVQATGNYITNGTSLNGNGMAYLGDHFYYSRLDTRTESCGLLCSNDIDFTDIYRVNATTGVGEYIGRIDNFQFGDLGSCATVTNVPSSFTFNCGDPSGGLQTNALLADGTTQTDVLRIPITNAVTGLDELTITGTGISTSPSPYEVNIEQGATYVDVPISFDGSGAVGTRSLTITSKYGTGTCNMNIDIQEDADGDGVLSSVDTDETDPCIPVQSAGYTGYDSANATWAADDCDADGVLNGQEVTDGTDPYDVNAFLDADGDGVADTGTTPDADPADPCIPVQSASYTGYDETNTTWQAGDCDGDGENNGTEHGSSDPYDPCDPDANDLACPTGDYDGDGVANSAEVAGEETNPCLPVQIEGYSAYDSANAIWAAGNCDGDADTNGAEATAGSDPYCDLSTVSNPSGSCTCAAGPVAPIIIKN